jgi:hypothetical protein
MVVLANAAEIRDITDSRRWETLILTNGGDSAHIDPS